MVARPERRMIGSKREPIRVFSVFLSNQFFPDKPSVTPVDGPASEAWP